MHYGTSYNKCSFYQGFYIAVGHSVQWVLKMVALLMVTVLVAAPYVNKESFKGRCEQL